MAKNRWKNKQTERHIKKERQKKSDDGETSNLKKKDKRNIKVEKR